MGRDFRKILAWEKADDLVVEVYHATARFFPREERYGLTAQIREAAVSVASNMQKVRVTAPSKVFATFFTTPRAHSQRSNTTCTWPIVWGISTMPTMHGLQRNGQRQVVF